jgi:hypothetical protein
MNLIKSTCALFVAVASISSNIQATSIKGAETTNISIKQIVMPGSSGLVSCHNTLANCLVSLKFVNPNEGWIVLLNNSRVDARNVKATLPPDWGSSVIPTTTCDVIRVGQSCTLKFIAAVSSPLSRQTIPVKGDNTTTVFFDMEVIP